MNFFDLINKCLIELNYKSVKSFEDLNTADHKRLMNIINMLNRELVLSQDWDFREKILEETLPEGTSDVVIPGKVDSVFFDGDKIPYEPDYTKFIDGTASDNCYSYYAGKLVIKPLAKSVLAHFRYFTTCCALDASQAVKNKMEVEADSSIIPAIYAENVLVYGACMRFKAMPSHPKYKHWSGEYVRGLRLLNSSALKASAQCPRIMVKGDLS